MIIEGYEVKKMSYAIAMCHPIDNWIVTGYAVNLDLPRFCVRKTEDDTWACDHYATGRRFSIIPALDMLSAIKAGEAFLKTVIKNGSYNQSMKQIGGALWK